MTVFFLNNSLWQHYVAREFKSFFGMSDSESVLVIRNHEGHVSKLRTAPKSTKDMTAVGCWTEIIYVGGFRVRGMVDSIKSHIKFQRLAMDILHRFPGTRRVVFGNYGSEMMRNVANKIKDRTIEVYFLDEGIGTLHLYQSRARNRTGTLKNAVLHRAKQEVVSIVKRVVFGIDTRDVYRRVVFFTDYNLKSTRSTEIVKNDYRSLREEIKNFTAFGEAYFLGTPYVNRRRIAKERYLEIVKNFLQANQGLAVKYVPHPREDVEVLKGGLTELAVDILRVDAPIEIFLIQTKGFPRAIGGFTSTGIATLNLMFLGLMKVFVYKLSDESIREDELLINDYFRKENLLNSEFIDEV